MGCTEMQKRGRMRKTAHGGHTAFSFGNTETPQTFKGNYMAGSWELHLLTAVTLTVKGRQT